MTREKADEGDGVSDADAPAPLECARERDGPVPADVAETELLREWAVAEAAVRPLPLTEGAVGED